MNKTELIERFTTQRGALSQIRGLLREQIEKCQRVTVEGGNIFSFGHNPIVMEVFEASKSVNLAFMWLGKAKGFLGEAHPYKESYNPENKVIEEAVDVVPPPDKYYAGPVEMLKSLRSDLKALDRGMSSNLGFAQGDSSELYESVQNAFTHFHEACMWLGVALGNIKDMGVEETIAWRKVEEEGGFGMTLGILKNPAPEGAPTKESEGNDADPEKKSPAGSIEPPIGSEENKLKTDVQPKSDESDTKGGIKIDNPEGTSRSGSRKNKASDKTAGGQSDSKAGPGAGENG